MARAVKARFESCRGWGRLGALALVAGVACNPPEAGIRQGHGLILAEAIQVYSRQEVVSDGCEWKGWHTRLLKAGFQDAEIADGTEVLLRTEFYRNNAQGKIREGTLMAHLQPGVQVKVAFLEGFRMGDLVEAETTWGGTPGRSSIPTVLRVRDRRAWRPDGPPEWSSHRYALYQATGFESWMKALNPLGGPDSGCITGDELEAEGWVQRRYGLGYVWWKSQ